MKKIISIGIIACLIANTPAKADNWMARLDDATPITMLSIPGTHDSGTGNGFTPEWAEYSKELCVTQDCPLSQQWASGIRAFDLRPTVIKTPYGKSTLQVFHGPMKTNLNFEMAIIDLIDSVVASPSEFAFVIMRHENDGDNDSKEWESLMDDFLNSAGIKEHIVSYSPSLTVKDMRGKLLVMSRVNYGATPVGAYIDDWTSDEGLRDQVGAAVWGNNGYSCLYVQDYYDTTSTEKMDTKLYDIVRMLTISTNRHYSSPATYATASQPIIINHTSGYSEEKNVKGISAATSNGYRDNAAHTNKTVIEFLKHHNGPVGFVMMDFAGVNESCGYDVRSLELTHAVINQNFK